MSLQENNPHAISVALPRTLGVGNLASLIDALSQIDAGVGDVELDCSNVNFVDPLGMTVLAATLETLDKQRRVSMPWLSTQIASYMERMDFFNGISVEGVNVPKNRIRNDQRSSLLELTRVVDSGSSEVVADQLATAIVGTIIGRAPKWASDTGYEPDTEYDQYYRPLRYALSELVENALTHARREGAFNASVWIAAQYYKDQGGRIQVAVVDNGCGFLATLQNHAELRAKNHAEAIRTALKPKVSCNRDIGLFGESVNEGVGLTTTVRIAKETGGSVHIVSGDAIFSDGEQGVKRRDQVQPLKGTWNGVAISATFVCQKLPAIRIDQLLPPEETSKLLTNPIVFRFEDDSIEQSPQL